MARGKGRQEQADTTSSNEAPAQLAGFGRAVAFAAALPARSSEQITRLTDRTGALLVLAGFVLFTTASIKADLFEIVLPYLRSYEARQLDEFLSALFIAGLIALVLLWRRTTQLRGQIALREAAEQRATDQARLLSLAQSAAGAGAWSLDLRTQITTISPECRAMLNLPDDHDGEIDVAEWALFLHPDDMAAAEQVARETIAARSNYRNDYRIRAGNGGYRWIRSLGRIVEDDRGKPCRLIGLMFDITDRRQSARSLRQSEERLRLALEAVGDGAWDWDLTNNQVARSDRLVRKLGYDPVELEARSAELLDKVHPDDAGKMQAAMRRHLDGESDSYSAEFRLLDAAGQWRWILDRGSVVGRDATTGKPARMVGTSSDITARKTAELELQRIQAEMIHLSRLNAMGEMASTLAHELNQPLGAISNFARGLRRHLDRNCAPAVGEALVGLEESALRAGDIVRRLRNYVAKGEIERSPVSLKSIVEDACALSLVDAPVMGIDHAVDLDPAADCVMADRIQLQQVLLNLIRNGVEALLDSASERKLIISSRGRPRRQVEISVTDTGGGIPPQLREQLFGAFVTSKVGGMGLGLSICRTIVEAHEGRIWAEARPDGGTIMRFTLPRGKEERMAPRVVKAA